MLNVVTGRLWGRLLALAGVAAVTLNQAAGCALAPTELARQIPTFVQDFARQVLAAYLL